MTGPDLFAENDDDINVEIFDGIVDFLDIEMEYSKRDIGGGDLNVELQSPSDDLEGLSSIFSGDISNGTPELSTDFFVLNGETSGPKQLPDIIEGSTYFASERFHSLGDDESFYVVGDSSGTHLPPGALNPAQRNQKKKKRKKLSLLSDAIEMNGLADKKKQKIRSLQQPVTTGKCMHCGLEKTSQWRAGPMGRNTLCNPCGIRYRSGRLFPEYRPACSPTFVASLHSNYHVQVLKMRNEAAKEATIARTNPSGHALLN